ncbi:MAG: carbamoyltransferase HypF, partial [Acidimicrobiales bacterium]
TLIPPDTATCDDCVAEVLDPTNRRFRHAFTTCTACGPRFTIIGALPYDRPHTTMREFALCAACAAEYSDPRDRRHHAQPIACHRCGPQLQHERFGQVTTGTDDVLAAVQADVDAGLIVAIKGLGGYHLAVDATSDEAVNRLRRRKDRADKPFAVMVADLDAARRMAHINDAEASALRSPAHPIVLLRARAAGGVSPFVAPGNPLIGVLLPYTPFHHLLFGRVPGADIRPPSAVVMTSGNVSEEPICFDDDDARRRLAPIADSFCTHNRPIHTPCDDSVIRLVDGSELPIRRSRGHAPLPVGLPGAVVPTLAVGGEIKNTFAVAAGSDAWLSQHLGDMSNHETLTAFESSVARLTDLYRVDTQRLAVDAHPGYHTRRWATEYADRLAATTTADVELVEVQHHHAHLASLMAEHGHDGRRPVIGFVFDGTGYGTDHTMWGGEVLVGDYAAVDRWGHLGGVLLPGGDSAVHNPCRTALAHLRASDIDWSETLAPVLACDETERRILHQQLTRSTNCVTSSSMGRLFDAVASLLGLRHRITYEAQAAIDLEFLADRAVPTSFRVDFALHDDGSIDPAPVLRGLVRGLESGVDRAALAYAFHQAVADVIGRCAERIRDEQSLHVAGLTGGVFQNVLLTRLAGERLRQLGFEVLTHRVVPPNDGGLALGQVMVAAHRSRRPAGLDHEGSRTACV